MKNVQTTIFGKTRTNIREILGSQWVFVSATYKNYFMEWVQAKTES